MIRVLAWLCAAVTLLASGHAQAQFFDMRDIMGGGPNFRGGGYGGYSGGGSGPIPRGAVMLQGYAPGTIVIHTGERRLYLVQATARP